MKRIYSVIKKELSKNKKITIVLGIIMVIGFLFGTLFVTILKTDDKKLVIDSINTFFNNVKNNKLDNFYIFSKSIFSNLFYIFIIFILGISIIGIPIILLILFIKSFILGFSISSIMLKYKFNGLILSFIYIFPHQLIYIFSLIILSLYGMYISLSLYKVIFSKKEINFKLLIKRYIVICIICILLSSILSLFEAFITPKLINLFSFLIK